MSASLFRSPTRDAENRVFWCAWNPKQSGNLYMFSLSHWTLGEEALCLPDWQSSQHPLRGVWYHNMSRCRMWLLYPHMSVSNLHNASIPQVMGFLLSCASGRCDTVSHILYKIIHFLFHQIVLQYFTVEPLIPKLVCAHFVIVFTVPVVCATRQSLPPQVAPRWAGGRLFFLSFCVFNLEKVGVYKAFLS